MSKGKRGVECGVRVEDDGFKTHDEGTSLLL